jgi:hypothetical protein
MGGLIQCLNRAPGQIVLTLPTYEELYEYTRGFLPKLQPDVYQDWLNGPTPSIACLVAECDIFLAFDLLTPIDGTLVLDSTASGAGVILDSAFFAPTANTVTIPVGQASAKLRTFIVRNAAQQLEYHIVVTTKN